MINSISDTFDGLNSLQLRHEEILFLTSLMTNFIPLITAELAANDYYFKKSEITFDQNYEKLKYTVGVNYNFFKEEINKSMLTKPKLTKPSKFWTRVEDTYNHFNNKKLITTFPALTQKLSEKLNINFLHNNDGNLLTANSELPCALQWPELSLLCNQATDNRELTATKTNSNNGLPSTSSFATLTMDEKTKLNNNITGLNTSDKIKIANPNDSNSNYDKWKNTGARPKTKTVTAAVHNEENEYSYFSPQKINNDASASDNTTRIFNTNIKHITNYDETKNLFDDHAINYYYQTNPENTTNFNGQFC